MLLNSLVNRASTRDLNESISLAERQLIDKQKALRQVEETLYGDIVDADLRFYANYDVSLEARPRLLMLEIQLLKKHWHFLNPENPEILTLLMGILI